MQQVFQRVPRLFLGGSLLALLALLTFNVSTTHAAGPCGSPIVVTPGNPGTCTIGGNLVATTGDLTYTVDPNLTISSGTGTPIDSTNGIITSTGTATPYTYQLNGTNQTFDIAFDTMVSDGRGDATGWSLAASTNLPSNFATTLTGVAANCNSDSTCFPDSKALVTIPSLPLTLSNSAQEFISTPISPLTTGGDYTIATTGTLTVPGDIPAGFNITGNLIITLNSVNFT